MRSQAVAPVQRSAFVAIRGVPQNFDGQRVLIFVGSHVASIAPIMSERSLLGLAVISPIANLKGIHMNDCGVGVVVLIGCVHTVGVGEHGGRN